MKSTIVRIKRLGLVSFLIALHGTAVADDDLAAAFDSPPLAARTRCFWWWLNSNVDKAAITKDLEWMKSIGMGGGLIFDAGGGAGPTPTGPLFGSPEWKELFVHAVKEAARLGLELGLSPQSGWNLGGPGVTPEQSGKVIAWSEMSVTGPRDFNAPLPVPAPKEFHDTVVLGYRSKAGKAAPIRQLREKALFKELGGSAENCRPLLEDIPATPGEADTQPAEVVNLTARHTAKDGLQWQVPPGDWRILRFGWTLNGGHVSTSSGNWKGLMVDYLDAEALKNYWQRNVDPLLDAVGILAGEGKSLTKIETDSWEGGGLNWSRTLPEAFRRSRGYELTPWLPVIAGRIVGDRDRSNRFLADLRKTIAELMAEQKYAALSSLASNRGLGTHCEAGGPHIGPFDALSNLGHQSAPMGEFWVPSPHRPKEQNRFFMKTPASAAHLYGKRVVGGEGFTSIGPHWNDSLWSAQKPTFDHEACAGLNLTYWHAFTCSPASAGIPGQEYFAGTHFNPQITWAGMAQGIIGYLNRCQALLQRGLPVSDVLVYVGDHAPNVPGRKQAAPAGILPGYDFDWCNEDALLNRITAKDGLLVLPDGVSYKALVLPDHGILSLPVARKLRKFVKAGVAITGPKPVRTASLSGWPESEAELKSIADELWQSGRIATGPTAADLMNQRGVAPDVEWSRGKLDWIHRRDGAAEIYFVCNQDREPINTEVSFRVQGRQPEFWNPLTGERRDAAAFTQEDGRTCVPISFDPYGSMFVIFRKPVAALAKGEAKANEVKLTQVAEISSPWTVAFDPAWGGPASVSFATLGDWTKHPDEGVRNYSGTAAYQATFSKPPGNGPFILDLGKVAEMAMVRVNGKDLGRVIWTPPYRIALPADLKATGNQLEIRVANTWWNRLLADQALPKEKRLTRTNVTPKPGGQPLPSGLFGPVTIRAAAP
ncbi:MAG: hypothetical protein RLZZ214_1841 [Verrucomicrobiota bacterium]|jgi:hypothetical protein